MLGSMTVAVSQDVLFYRRKLGLSPEKLAKKAEVGVRFIRNVENQNPQQLKKAEGLHKLLRVLKVLKLKLHMEAVEKALKVRVIKKKRKRIDRRVGGVVHSRRGR